MLRSWQCLMYYSIQTHRGGKRLVVHWETCGPHKEELATIWQCRAAAPINTQAVNTPKSFHCCCSALCWPEPMSARIFPQLLHLTYSLCVWLIFLSISVLTKECLHTWMFPMCLFKLHLWPWGVTFFRLQVFVQPLPGPRVERFVQRLLWVWCDPL